MKFKQAPGLLLGLSLSFAYFLGCATHQYTEAAPASAQTVYAQPASGGAQRWAYQCTEGYNARTIVERANTLGQQGWEMVAGLGSARVAGLWCFKRPL